jgi:aminopeptidase N
MSSKLFLLVSLLTSLTAAALEAGVPLSLAKKRFGLIKELRYELEFLIPASVKEPVTGKVRIFFSIPRKEIVALDVGKGVQIQTLKVNGKTEAPLIANEHLELTNLKSGENEVALEFMGAGGLLRRDDLAYTLFVPDRASQTFPCFDQPDLKARYTLSLVVPKAWETVSQGSIIKTTAKGEQKRIDFKESALTSTYLFAFATGRFSKVTRQVGGREMTLYHRESDPKKVARNLDAIFEMHDRSLKFMKEYTGIDYPFEKFDFVLLPSFPFGGMEHPGSIFYNEKNLFLDESATTNQYLGRANVIAHETSHMWFGDLVTMKWFDDVWLKEVFANFMADKIANPMFPEINHDLRFFLNHYPLAYSADRTKGTNPIAQKLGNLNQASSLYGNIIYHKAPIVMRMLENKMTSEKFRDVLRNYLKRFQFSNASWTDLFKLASQVTPGLEMWNRKWIYGTGRPTLKIAKLGESYEFTSPKTPDYGLFAFTTDDLTKLLHNISLIADENLRAISWVALWDNVLERKIAIQDVLEIIPPALEKEKQELIVSQLLGYTRTIYWSLLDEKARGLLAPSLEGLFWKKLADAALPLPVRNAYFKAFQSIFLSEDGWRKLHRVWSGKIPQGLTLSERDRMEIAYALALREKQPDADKILDKQKSQIKDIERSQEFAFVRRSVVGTQIEFDNLFAELLKPEGRKNEPWALDALAFLHHPLHGKESEKYIDSALTELSQIKRTQGIFFPLEWVSNSLAFHINSATKSKVDRYLKAHPELDDGLHLKVLQAADLLDRFAK